MASDYTYRKFRSVDPYRIRAQEHQSREQDHCSFSPESFEKIGSNGYAVTFEHGEDVAAIVGVYRLWTGRGLAWALFAESVNRWLLLSVHRPVLDFLDNRAKPEFGFHRVEAHVDCGFRQAKRWMDILGFCQEGMMRSFSPDRRDYYLYSRVY